MAETDFKTALRTFPEININASFQQSKVTLSWTKVPSAEKYDIKRALKASGPFTHIEWAKDTEFTDTAVEKGVSYWYKVVAYKTLPGKKIVTQDSFAAPAVLTEIPEAKGLTAIAGEGRIKLSWTSDEGDKWLVYRKSDDFSLPIFLGEAKKKEFTDTTPVPGQAYRYFVQVVRNGENGKALPGKFSSEVYACSLNTTEILSAKALHGKNVSIAVRLVCGCDGYILERSEKKDSAFTEVARTEELTQNVLSAKAPARLKTYYYRVRAYKLIASKEFYGEYCPVKAMKTR